MTYDPPRVTVAAHISFGQKGNAWTFQMGGWSTPEDGFTWSTGHGSRLRIPFRAGTGRLVVELTLAPLVLAPVMPAQLLIVEADGHEIGREMLADEAALAFVVPSVPQGRDGEIVLALNHPMAVTPADLGLPADPRTLGVAVRDILLLWMPPEAAFTPRRRPPLPGPDVAEAVRGCTALSPLDLVAHFASLGRNCEFGLVQRAVMAEPLGLLRFGAIGLHKLLLGLDESFDGIEELSQLTVHTEQNVHREEYVVRAEKYGVAFHTYTGITDTTPDDMRQRMTVHLGFLRRMFEETLAEGRHIFVLHNQAAITPASVLPILHLLRSHGPNALLYVTEDETIPPGTVDQLRPDLFHGYTNQLMGTSPDRINLPAWLSICANAYRLWREGGGGAA